MLGLRKHVVFAFLACGLCVLATPASAQATATPADLKVAFTGDQSLGAAPEEVLRLVLAEGAEALFIQGDFDYSDDPLAWEAMLDGVLGPNFPVIALVGNHDEAAWYGAGGYQDRLTQRMQRSGVPWLGELGVQATVNYKGLFVVQTSAGVFDGYDNAAFIRESLAQDQSIWSVSGWHKLMADMQVGGKGNETGWEVYEESRRGGAIIATAHEHSYSRTHLLSSMENRTVASTAQPLVLAADDAATDADEGRSFAFVSGLGGNSIRDQERTGDWWASVYTSTQGASNGALFAIFNVSDDPRLAHFYFKDVTGKVADDFTVRSTVDQAAAPTSTTSTTTSTTSTTTTSTATSTTSTTTTSTTASITSTTTTSTTASTTSTTTTSTPASTTSTTTTSTPASTTSTTTTSTTTSTTSTTTTSSTTITTSTTTTSTATSTTLTTTTSTTASTTSTTTTSTNPPVTTTSTPTTTAPSTSSTTATTGPSTSTTSLLPAAGLSGQYPFGDKSTGSANTSFLNLDTGRSQVCVAGQVQGSDGAANVAFSYDSLGSIGKATSKSVRGGFVSVSLTLDITGGTSPAYRQTIQAACKLKASLQKAGSRNKVSLRCDFGDHYSAFPGLTSQQVMNIDNAFAHQKRVKATSKNGRLKVSHVGVPSPAGVPVTCALPR